MGFPGKVDWIVDLIPDLNSRLEPFVVDTDEVDDELIEVFVDELRRLAGELQDGVLQKDAEIMRMAAHSIKGMGGTIGLPEISVLGQEIEIRIKAEPLADSMPLVEGLVNWLSTFQ